MSTLRGMEVDCLRRRFPRIPASGVGGAFDDSPEELSGSKEGMDSLEVVLDDVAISCSST